LLRQEKGISQRQAAAALGISQALLSHYENGIREPGLTFVVKACDFYNVSADFLLGRSMSRDGTTILDAETLYDVSSEKDNVLQGSVMATLGKKLVVNSVSVLYGLLGRLGNRRAIKGAINYVSTGIYILFRHLYQVSDNQNDGFFSVPRCHFMTGLPRADLMLTETDYVEALHEGQKEGVMPSMSHDDMAAQFPGTYQSLLQVIHACGGRMSGLMTNYSKNLK
jgi:transcriptional regulator with XRE-family HTH domain